MEKIRAILLLSVLVLATAGCSDQKISYPSRQLPDNIAEKAELMAWAQDAFLSKCAYCHGHESEGRGPRANFFQPPAPDFYESRYSNADPAYLYWRIDTGKTEEPFLSQGSVMPAWGMHFSDEKIWALVVFLQQRATAD